MPRDPLGENQVHLPSLLSNEPPSESTASSAPEASQYLVLASQSETGQAATSHVPPSQYMSNSNVAAETELKVIEVKMGEVTNGAGLVSENMSLEGGAVVASDSLTGVAREEMGKTKASFLSPEIWTMILEEVSHSHSCRLSFNCAL
jgi:hypothetical protein